MTSHHDQARARVGAFLVELERRGGPGMIASDLPSGTALYAADLRTLLEAPHETTPTACEGDSHDNPA
jgi:hypothetical protein